MKFRLPNLYTVIIVTKIKERFLKEKRKGKRFIFFIFYFYSLFICYDLSKLNLTMVRNSPANDVVFGLLSFLSVRILDTVNLVLFCQFKLKMAV